jgi:hypothetical protein
MAAAQGTALIGGANHMAGGGACSAAVRIKKAAMVFDRLGAS